MQKRIWDWSRTLPSWQSALWHELSQGPLTDAARDNLLGFLLGDADARTPPALELSDLPADETEHGVVELREMRNLRNLNRLAGGQSLRFGLGLNIVFGESGTGKSGHGWLLPACLPSRRARRGAADVFDAGAGDAPPTAEFVLSIDGHETAVVVDLTDDPPRLLSAMTAFDASCARVYLSRANTIDHTPRSFRLLKEMATAQDQMTQAPMTSPPTSEPMKKPASGMAPAALEPSVSANAGSAISAALIATPMPGDPSNSVRTPGELVAPVRQGPTRSSERHARHAGLVAKPAVPASVHAAANAIAAWGDAAAATRPARRAPATQYTSCNDASSAFAASRIPGSGARSFRRPRTQLAIGGTMLCLRPRRSRVLLGAPPRSRVRSPL